MLEYSLEKRAYIFGLDPKQIGNLILGVTTANAATSALGNLQHKINKGKSEKAFEKEVAKTFNSRLNYYTEIRDIVKNLAVIFTPVSVVYQHNGVIVDILEMENMNEEMKKQWKAKNADYFRELLFKKMSTEIQMAQQFVAQKMLERSMSINDMAMGKQASDHSGECEFQKLNDLREFVGTIDYLQKIANYKSIYENLIDFNSEDSMFKVSMTVSDWSGHLGQLDNDFITEKIAFIDLWDKDTLKRISPADIIKKLKVYFLPDKVAFVVNGMTISHLSLTSMSEEAVHKFYEKNKEYFKNVFLEKSCELEKQATFSNDEGSLLRNPDTSPLVLVSILNKRWAKEWINWEPAVLIATIEKKIVLKEIPETNVEKILISQAAILHEKVFTEPFIYEKCVRSFNNHPTELDVREDVALIEMANANRLLFAISKKDPYKLFNIDTARFMRDALFSENMRVFMPAKLAGDNRAYDIYVRIVNELLLEKWNDMTANKRIQEPAALTIQQENEVIASAIMLAITLCRENPVMPKETVNKIIAAAIDYYDVDYDEATRTLSDDVLFEIIKKNVIKNLEADEYMLSQMQEEKRLLKEALMVE